MHDDDDSPTFIRLARAPCQQFIEAVRDSAHAVRSACHIRTRHRRIIIVIVIAETVDGAQESFLSSSAVISPLPSRTKSYNRPIASTASRASFARRGTPRDPGTSPTTVVVGGERSTPRLPFKNISARTNPLITSAAAAPRCRCCCSVRSTSGCRRSGGRSDALYRPALPD